MRVTLPIETGQSQLLSQRTLERLAAFPLVLYCVAQIVTIVARITSGTDQPGAVSSLLLFSTNCSLYLASKVANLAAAFLLFAFSVLLYRVFNAYDRTWALLSATTLFAAGLFWLVSSLSRPALAEIYGKSVSKTAVLATIRQPSHCFSIGPVRAMAGRSGSSRSRLPWCCWADLPPWQDQCRGGLAGRAG